MDADKNRSIMDARHHTGAGKTATVQGPSEEHDDPLTVPKVSVAEQAKWLQKEPGSAAPKAKAKGKANAKAKSEPQAKAKHAAKTIAASIKKKPDTPSGGKTVRVWAAILVNKVSVLTTSLVQRLTLRCACSLTL